MNYISTTLLSIRDHNLLLTANALGELKIWDIESGQSTVLSLHDFPVKKLFSISNGAFVVTEGLQKTRITKMEDRSSQFLTDEKLQEVHVLPDNRGIIGWTAGKEVYHWNSRGERLPLMQSHKEKITDLCYNAKNGYIIFLLKSGTAQMRDEHDNILANWSVGKDVTLCFLNNGETIAYVSADGKSVRFCPLPDVVLQEMATQDWEQETKQMQEKYNLQFVGE